VSGRVAGTFAGTVALFFAAPALAETGASSGGAAYPSEPAVESPGTLPADGGGGSGGAPYSTSPHSSSSRPLLTVFSASASALNAGRPIVRFQVTDHSARVRVRLAFVSVVDRSTYRLNLGSRRTGITHAFTWRPPRNVTTGTYRVRITARDPEGHTVVRATSISVSPPAVATDHRFPVEGPHNFGDAGARFGAQRSGHTHQGQDIIAAQGVPVVAPHAGKVTWVAYQEGGAGYYVVLASSSEPYYYVFMHLTKGSVLVRPGDLLATGQRLGLVGATGAAEGPHLHFEIWDGPWQQGGHPIDPLPFLRQWPGA
jgi:murein DD-endopeptidase MepM/ murein hydrolase activator NlpD